MQGNIVRWRKIEGPVTEVQHLLSEESKALEKEDSKKTDNPMAVTKKVPKDSWWTIYCKDSANAALTAGKDLIKKAEEAINKKKMDMAENLYRKSLTKIREALLWEPKEKTYIKYLHDIGHQIHDIFGCQLEFKDG